MKQIFDWLREQMQIGANLNSNCPSMACWARANKDCDKCDLKSLRVRDIFEVIDEAEAKCSDIEQDAYERGYVLGFDNGYKDGQFFEKAKWEADCCEWVIGNFCAKIECLGKVQEVGSPHDYNFCPYCGRKISEVE